MKVLYFDVETTGLDPVKHGIVQIAAVAEVDGVEVGRFVRNVAPYPTDEIDPRAMAVHGMTSEKVAEYEPAPVVKSAFCGFLSQYVNKFDKNDKLYPAGYNVRFDLDFVKAWFEKAGDNYWGSWQNWKALDPLPYLRLASWAGLLPGLTSHKLVDAAGYFGIEIDAHDALSDVLATREILHRIKTVIAEPTR